MSKITVSNTVRIQSEPEYYYTVENTNIDNGCEGCTISYWETAKIGKRLIFLTLSEQEAIAVANEILKMFQQKDNQ